MLRYFLISLFAILCFNGKADTLTVAYNVSPPFVKKEDGKLTGTSVWLWNKIAEENNYHIQYKEYSLDEMLIAIERNEVDLSLNPITINNSRLNEMEFSIPFYLAHSGVMIREDSTFSKAISFLESFLSVNFFRALLAVPLLSLQRPFLKGMG